MSDTAGTPFCLYLSKTFIVRMFFADNQSRRYSAEIYPENGKMKKQMEYANRRGIPCVVIVGSRELEERVATIKDMTSGEQTQVPFTRLAEALR